MELIVAVYDDWGIGCCGTQPVALSADRKFFREQTRGAMVIVGRKTLGDFPGGKPLPNRVNVVLTRGTVDMDGVVICHSPEEAVELAMYLSAAPEGQQQLIDANIQIPNSISVADEWASDTESIPNNKQEFLDIVGDYGRALPGAMTYTQEWYDEFFINIQPVLDGDMTAEEYLEQIEPRMQGFLEQSIQQHEVSREN